MSITVYLWEWSVKMDNMGWTFWELSLLNNYFAKIINVVFKIPTKLIWNPPFQHRNELLKFDFRKIQFKEAPDE